MPARKEPDHLDKLVILAEQAMGWKFYLSPSVEGRDVPFCYAPVAQRQVLMVHDGTAARPWDPYANPEDTRQLVHAILRRGEPEQTMFHQLAGDVPHLSRACDAALRVLMYPPKLPNDNPPKPRRPMSHQEREAAAWLGRCTYLPGSFDKRFGRDMAARAERKDAQITEGQAAQIWRQVWRYRRQIGDSQLIDMAKHKAKPVTPAARI
jgi:hypothetical protein